MPTTRTSSETFVSRPGAAAAGRCAPMMGTRWTVWSSSTPPATTGAGHHGDGLAVLLSDLAPGEVQEHVVERGAMGPDGAHRDPRRGHDRTDGRLFVGDKRGEADLGALHLVTSSDKGDQGG